MATSEEVGRRFSAFDEPFFKHPFTALVSGPSGSGKTYFVKELVENAAALISPPPEEIVWCYSVWQPVYESIRGAKFIEGLNYDLSPDKATLLILDDLMDVSDKKVGPLFTKLSHHSDTSVVHVVQNLFHKSAGHRDASLNAHYIILFKNPRNVGQVDHLARQMSLGNSKFISGCYRDATAQRFGYLLIDLTGHAPDELRLRTRIFPGDFTLVYRPTV